MSLSYLDAETTCRFAGRLAAELTRGQRILVVGHGALPIARLVHRHLPASTLAERDDVAAAYGALRLPPPDGRPLRMPHHTVSRAALVGGADRVGELGLAMHGLLVLDELAAFATPTVEALAVALTHDDRLLAFAPSPATAPERRRLRRHLGLLGLEVTRMPATSSTRAPCRRP